jgi:glycosyltransferase involved in cell wall biosynthesis/O-antigen/teichoic acid export membrane protein
MDARVETTTIVGPGAAPNEALLESLRSTMTGRFSRDTALLLASLAMLNASNYVFHVVVSRLLGPADYGGLAALLALLMVVSVPIGVVQTIVAKRAAMLRAAGRESEIAELAAGSAKLVTAGGAALLIVLVALSPLLGAFLKVGTISVALLAPYMLAALLSAVGLGVLQGRLQFGRIAVATVVGVAVRLLAGVGLVSAGLGVSGAVLATAGAQAVAAAVVLALAGVPLAARRSRLSLDAFRGEFGAALLALASFWVLAELDVVLARHFLAESEGGFYSTAGLLTRGLLIAPAAVAIAALPRFASARGSIALHWLRLAVVAVGVLAVAGALILVPGRELLVSVAFGSEFAEAAGLVPVLTFAVALLSVVNILVFFHIAQGTRAYLLVVVGVTAELVLVTMFHESAEQIALVFLGVTACVAVLLLHAAVGAARWQPAAKRIVHEGLASAPSVQLSLVLPCHNVGDELGRVLARVRDELADFESYELIVVSDGSTDGTVAIANGPADTRIRVLDYPEHVGKGHALRVGLGEARGEYVAFLDADGDIDAAYVRPFLEIMKLFAPDIVVGSKRHPLSDVSYPPLRRLMSWTYHKLTRALFRVNVQDTQTGLKLIRRDVLAAVLPRMLEKRYAFDLEFLVVARRLGFKRVFEAPVRLDYQFSSRVDVRAVTRVLVDTLAIFYRVYILRTYGAVVAPRSRPHSRGRRIVFVNWRDVRHPDAGGAEVWTHEVTRRWVADGDDVTLLTSRFPGAKRSEVVDGVRVRRVGRLRCGTYHLRVQLELARLRGFDAVVEGVNTLPFFTPLWRRTPSVALFYQFAADVWDAELPRPLAAFGRWLEPRLLKPYRGTSVVAISESTGADLRRVGARDVVIVHSGVDAPADTAVAEKEQVPTFLYVGRLARNKRPDHAVEAFRVIRETLPEARLWIIGSGPLEQHLADGLPEGAELLGYVGRSELYERMARAHCLLVPSVREGWGLVVIEANAVGTPAVGYDVPGLRDSIRDGETGLLAPAGDPVALAGRALELVGRDARYGDVCRNAIAWAAQFSWDATARTMRNVVERSIVAAETRTAEPVLSFHDVTA